MARPGVSTPAQMRCPESEEATSRRPPSSVTAKACRPIASDWTRRRWRPRARASSRRLGRMAQHLLEVRARADVGLALGQRDAPGGQASAGAGHRGIAVVPRVAQQATPPLGEGIPRKDGRATAPHDHVERGGALTCRSGVRSGASPVRESSPERISRGILPGGSWVTGRAACPERPRGPARRRAGTRPSAGRRAREGGDEVRRAGAAAPLARRSVSTSSKARRRWAGAASRIAAASGVHAQLMPRPRRRVGVASPDQHVSSRPWSPRGHPAPRIPATVPCGAAVASAHLEEVAAISAKPGRCHPQRDRCRRSSRKKPEGPSSPPGAVASLASEAKRRLYFSGRGRVTSGGPVAGCPSSFASRRPGSGGWARPASRSAAGLERTARRAGGPFPALRAAGRRARRLPRPRPGPVPALPGRPVLGGEVRRGLLRGARPPGRPRTTRRTSARRPPRRRDEPRIPRPGHPPSAKSPRAPRGRRRGMANGPTGLA